MKTDIPEFVLKNHKIQTARQWKSLKRKQLRAIISALEEYRCGCAYTPSGNGEVGQITEQLESLRKNISVRNWGR